MVERINCTALLMRVLCKVYYIGANYDIIILGVIRGSTTLRSAGHYNNVRFIMKMFLRHCGPDVGGNGLPMYCEKEKKGLNCIISQKTFLNDILL